MKKQEIIKERRVFIKDGFYEEFKKENNVEIPLQKYLKTARNNLYDWKTNGMEISKFVKRFGAESLDSNYIEIIVKKEIVSLPTRKQILDLTKTETINEAARIIGCHRTQVYQWIRDGISEKSYNNFLKVFEENE